MTRFRTAGLGWRLAPSLVTLARQVEAEWPARHGADGTLGNLEHSSRTSDHNPDENGIVRAIDIGEVTEEDAFLLSESVRLSQDKRVKYSIHERRMWSSYPKGDIPAFTWRYYGGTNGHWSHVHFSTLQAYDHLFTPWVLPTGSAPYIPPIGGEIELMKVIDIQKALNRAGQTDYEGKPLQEDDEYGRRTASALAKGFANVVASIPKHNHPLLGSTGY